MTRWPAVILAGGRARRMGGGDKCLVPLHGKPLLAHAIAAIAPHVPSPRGILIASNSDPERFTAFGLPVLADLLPGFQGPLAGLLTGMCWAARQHPTASHMLSVAGDMPFLPTDLAARLGHGLRQGGAAIAIARDSARSHPVVGLWPLALAPRLAADLERGVRAMHRWLADFAVTQVEFPAAHFANINTPADLARARGARALA